MRGVVVHHLGAWAVAIRRATQRTAGGTAGICEFVQVLGMDWLVALQDLDGFVNLEPLPLSSCKKATERVQKVQPVILWIMLFMSWKFGHVLSDNSAPFQAESLEEVMKIKLK